MLSSWYMIYYKECISTFTAYVGETFLRILLIEKEFHLEIFPFIIKNTFVILFALLRI